ncbi:hypothetical protein THRCLA_06386 [Thraustotheca clavata]|uniref:THH1/TOM1/TOM3 domain-containing protein n=1 Tax=Thraustotheca clavata TaxID=74557 RepID=A0A1V9ZPA8_9STRA|nr:hypothetical protein THRCLA_06386 [Thraustotheca clavata]
MDASHEAWRGYEKIRGRRVAGVLSLVLYTIVALGIVSRLVLHCRHKSESKRILFHVILLQAIVGNMPFSIEAVFYPQSERWIASYIAELYADSMLCCALAMLSISWARVAMIGQYERGPVRFRRFILGLAGFVLISTFGTAAGILVYADNSTGADEFNTSVLNLFVVSIGSILILFTSALVLFQATRIYRRMLQSRSMLGPSDFSRSSIKLFVSVWIILLCNTLRVFFIVCDGAEFNFVETMDIVPHTVWASLVPDVFPVICLLYLQRRMPTSSPTSQTSAPSDDVLSTATTTLDVHWNEHRDIR